jgi:Leucine-rich repeat (LRR) protein
MPIKTISKELVLEISRGYPDLKLLNLSNNEISVVENLAPLTALERLNLAGT